LRRNEDVNTQANVNKFDFLLNTFTKYCYILLSRLLRLNVILYVLGTTTTAKCRRHPIQSRSCVTHCVAYSYCHIFEFWDLLYQIGGLARSECIDFLRWSRLKSTQVICHCQVKSSRLWPSRRRSTWGRFQPQVGSCFCTAATRRSTP